MQAQIQEKLTKLLFIKFAFCLIYISMFLSLSGQVKKNMITNQFCTEKTPQPQTFKDFPFFLACNNGLVCGLMASLQGDGLVQKGGGIAHRKHVAVMQLELEYDLDIPKYDIN